MNANSSSTRVGRRAARWSSAALLALALVASTAGPAAGAGPVAPWVHVQAGRFVDASGQPVVLRGVDQQGGAGKVSNQLAAGLGASVVRVLVPWSSIETSAPSGGSHLYNQTKLASVDAQVSWYQAHGVNVLLDFHQFKWSPYFRQTGAEGIPGWFYSVTEAGRYTPDAPGMKQAMADWWTDTAGQQGYISFVQMMEARYSSHPNVVGYELFNEPMAGSLGENHAAAQAVIAWEAPVAAAMRAADPSRAVFFMLRGGGDNGLLNADMSAFGDMSSMVLDLHDYYNGIYGSGFTPDNENWSPSWDATHNQNFTDYHGTEYAQEQNLRVAINRARALGIPLFIGEWGVQTNDTGAAAFQSQMLDLFGRYGLSWARWDIGKGDPFTLVNGDSSLNAMGLGLKQALAVPAATSGVAPAADIRPTLSGFAQVTQTLNVDQGLWAGVPAPSVSYQWQRCTSGGSCVAVAGATAPSYTLTQADMGATVRAAVTGTNAAGASTASTALSQVVAPFALTLAGVTAVTSPVSPAITITWSQNQPATVRIEIRNASGACVKHLLYSGDYAAGTWVKKWGRLSDKGALVPAGTYTVVITATTATDRTVAQATVGF
jgi:endoglycosylceramidase